MAALDFLSDTTEQTSTRFVCFIGEKTLHRYDLAILNTNHFYGKQIVIELQGGLAAIIGPDDLEEEGYLERVFRLTPEQAEEMRLFLSEVVGPVSFSDI